MERLRRLGFPHGKFPTRCSARWRDCGGGKVLPRCPDQKEDDGGAMGQVGVFTGAALAMPDKLGRLSLPAVLRNSVPGDPASRTLFVTRHEVAPCLIGSGVDRLERIAEHINRAEDIAVRRDQDFDRYAMERRLYGPGESVPMDKSGRFILSDILAEIAEFNGEIFFYGVGQYFEIWDVDVLIAQTGETYLPAQQAVRAAMRVRDKKASKA